MEFSFSPSYSPAVMQAPLKETHELVFVLTSPLLLGFPARRLRSLGAGLNRATLVWCGPDTPEGVQEEFDTLYSRPCELDAGIYLRATEEEVYRYHCERAPRRGHCERAPRRGHRLDEKEGVPPLLSPLLLRPSSLFKVP